MKNISLDHAHLFTSDLSATITFFIKCFNAEVIWDEEAAGVRNVRIKIGRSFIHLYDQAPKAPRGGAIHHLGIETDDLEDLVLHIRNHGVTLKNEIKEEEKFKYVMIKGPDDLLIELFECKEPERWGITR
jgi:catechol 2,3-dioxygenase-like lactoylglutathione lyase family enzyme